MDPNVFRCIVVSMTDIGLIGREIKTAGIPVFALGMNPGQPTLEGISKLYQVLRQESVDIIQTWLYHADLLGLVVGRIAGVKRIVWGVRCSNMHLRNYRFLTALTVKLGSLLSPLADAIVFNSEEGKRVHRRRGYNTGRTVLIPNGFDTECFHPDESARDWLRSHLQLNGDVVLIGIVGRFDPMKDQRAFLKAASILVEKEDDVHFIMVGRGIEPQNEELMSYLGDGGLRGRVHLLGLRHDIPRIVAALDIATSSSAFGEGFSNTVGEAMACGVPCVVTDVGDSSRIVGDAGIVVPPRDPIAMAGAWEQLLKLGSHGRRLLGERARTRIAENYEIGRVVKRFEEVYQRLYGLTER
jgi:glycosyltransferase involved in cell wall biosynthesis